MTQISTNQLPVLFATSGLDTGNEGLVFGKSSGSENSNPVIVPYGTNHKRNTTVPPDIELEVVQSQQRVEKGQVLHKKDLHRFRVNLHNERLKQSDIDFLINQYMVAAAYSAETPKPKIAAAMFHLRVILARLRNLISQSPDCGKC